MLHVIHQSLVMMLLNIQLFLWDSFIYATIKYFPSIWGLNPLIIVAIGAMIIHRWFLGVGV